MSNIQYRILRESEIVHTYSQDVTGAYVLEGCLELDMVPVMSNSYACLEEDSPTPRLGVRMLQGDRTIVFHCGSTRRSVLCCVLPEYHPVKLINFVHWVAGGTGDLPLKQELGLAVWPVEFHPNVKVTITMFRDDARIKSRYLEFHQRIASYFAKIPGAGVELDLHPPQEPLPSSALSVEKTGTITIYQPARSKIYLMCAKSSELFKRWGSRHAYVGFANDGPTYNLIPCLYDGKSQSPPPKLREDQRLKLRRRKYGNALPEHDPFVDYMLHMLICELCCRDGKEVCANCKGAWYCSRAHQKADWKAHKAWCKAHPFNQEPDMSFYGWDAWVLTPAQFHHRALLLLLCPLQARLAWLMDRASLSVYSFETL